MTTPDSPLHKYDHKLLANSSKDFKPHKTSVQYQLLDNKQPHIITSKLEGKNIISNFMPFGMFPTQVTPIVSSMSLPRGQILQQPGRDSWNSYDNKSEQGFTTRSTQSQDRNPEYQTPIKCETPLGSVKFSPSSTSWEDPLFCFGPNVLAYNQMNPDLTGVVGQTQQHLWKDIALTGTFNGVPVAPQYPAFDATDLSGSSLYTTALDQHEVVRPSRKPLHHEIDGTTTIDSYKTDDDSARGEPPYAKLIYNALMDAPEHKLVLQDIYAWISNNTDKARDSSFKGWQNSVRHNLSMNGVCVKDLT